MSAVIIAGRIVLMVVLEMLDTTNVCARKGKGLQSAVGVAGGQ